MNDNLDDTLKIYKVACDLLSNLCDETPLRLIGLRTSGFDNNLDQVSFDDYMNKKAIDPTVDSLRKKYGNDIITPLSLLNTDFTNILQRKSDKIHSMKSKL